MSYSTPTPDTQKFIQSSSSDVFLVPESSRMEVDEVVDNLPNPSTPMKLGSVSPMAQLGMCISDDFLGEMYAALGFLVKDRNDDYIKRHLGSIFSAVKDVLLNDSRNMEKNLASTAEFLQNVRQRGEQEFIDLLKDMAEKESWQDLFENDVLWKQIPESPTQPQWSFSPASQDASLRAWSSIFKGRAADVLLDSISDYLSKDRTTTYTRHTTIVNSSGTGKSRMVDELATKIITVPMCLREDGTNGFPPSDNTLRDFFTSMAKPEDQEGAAKKLHGFMHSLLTILHNRLQAIASEDSDIPRSPTSRDQMQDRQEALASTFRKLMTKGQSFERSNEYRQRFYSDVVNSAKNFAGGSKPKPGTTADSPPRYISHGQGVKEAGKKLCHFIDPNRLLDANQGPCRPLVILAFDESHILTDNPKSGGWTLFSELRRTLRGIVKQAIFTLFLSTAGRFHLFSPRIQSDPSGRVTNSSLQPIDPITEISFDDLAFKAKKNTVSLGRVVETDWISHLGRPLFGAYNDALAHDDDELFLFAQQKLLDGWTSLIEENDKDQGPRILACLSVRFALEFNADSISREVECAQVERHMRLCIAATTGFERLVTLAGSEPLLAEAAWQLLHDSKANPVRHLAYHSDLNCIDRGRRGELVAELIVMQARDTAAWASNGRWVSVCDFIRALLPESSYQPLQSSLPIFWREGEDRPFTATFDNYALWFNHVIRVEDRRLIKSKYLWTFITRGAMISCPHNQEGVDIVLPICLKNENLSPDNVSAILIQVKNAKQFRCKIDKNLFDRMDPFWVGLFKEGSSTRPVIRMVFALASDEAGVLIPTRPPRGSSHVGDFTAFDIWCAGLRSFKNIQGDFDAYTKLLDRSLYPHDTFNLNETTDQHLDNVTKTSRAQRRQRMAALIRSGIGHRQIHVDVDDDETEEESA